MRILHVMSRNPVIFILIIFIFPNNVMGRVSDRLTDGILKSAHYSSPDNPGIICNIKADSLFCLASDNIQDTICIIVQVNYDINKQYINFVCNVVKFLNDSSTKSKLGWTFNSSRDYKDLGESKNELLLYPIYQQQRSNIESWISKINRTKHIESKRLTYHNDCQRYTLWFTYILVPKIHLSVSR